MSRKRIIVADQVQASDDQNDGLDFNVCRYFQGDDVEAWCSLDPDEIEKADAVVLPGGPPDVDPELYGEINTACGEIDRELDEKQFAMIDRAVKLKKPLFGICRGMQLISVYFGATMIQDIGCRHQHEFSVENPRFHTIYNVPGSCLFELFGPYVHCNSLHHQAVKKLPECLIPVQIWCKDEAKLDACLALAKEGKLEANSDCLIEAVVHKDYPYLGVQWHPEAKGTFSCRDTAPKQLRDYFCSLL